MRRANAAAAVCLVAVAAVAVIWLTGRGGSPARQSDPPPTTGTPIAPTVSARPGPSSDSEFPALIHAVRMRPTYVRLPVASGDLDNLVRVHRNVIVALATKGAFFGEVYAALSTDDGGGWRIDSPQFARAGGCGPCTTNHLNVSRDGTVFAWGNNGNYVKVTTDLGTRWYQSDFPEGVVSVTPNGRQLQARALGNQTPGGRFDTRRYISTNNGMTWQRSKQLPTVKN
jgi:hypothetical protein